MTDPRTDDAALRGVIARLKGDVFLRRVEESPEDSEFD
jgi:hypothetical protein